MLAVLYIAHGTRVARGVQQADHFLRSCMEKVPAPIQEICYLELVEPPIQEGIRRCVEKGARIVLVQPLLLLSAGHAKRDIPVEIERAGAHYPDVTFVYGQPFGVDERIVDILMERLHEKRSESREDTGVLLVGRGSSDPDTKRDFAAVCHLMKQRGVKRVAVCYMAAASPSFEEGLVQAQARGWKRTYVVPYLLFAGLLMKTMKKSIAEKNESGATFILCRPLGYHPALIELMTKRIREAIRDALPDHA
ncbi:sirohydrochlorin chelatase [Sporolactobacillus sp. THM7-7]|nr:sirohydrochlorin chelatase [Sporolactobacillus sp. THM7-7]